MMIRQVKRIFKNILPRTLLGRSLLILVTPLFLVQIITTYMFFDRHWEKMVDRMAYAVAGEIALISNELDANHETADIENIKKANQEALDLTLNFVPDAKLDKVFYDQRKEYDNPSRESVIAQTLAKAFDVQVMRPYNITVDRDEKWVVVSLQLDYGVLIVTLPERRIFSSSGYIVLLWMALSSIVLLIIAVLFMRNQIRPIRRLAIAAERFGKGRDVPFFKVEGAYEVRQAAKAFIEMKDRLQRQIQQRTAMLAGVSHDLRTPLTRMKLQLEMMSGPDVDDLKSDLADMERMIGAYLQFARGEGSEEPVRTNLSELIDRIARNTNRDQERVFVEGEKDVSLLLRPVAFERCINNLVTNSLKFGTQVWITIQRFGEMIEVRVDDNGPGVPPEQYDDVFKPFFRGEGSRNSKTGGVGLGLPIAQEIVLAHGGQIWLDKSPQGGLRVVIDLPV